MLYILPLLIGVIPLFVIIILMMRRQNNERMMDLRREALPTRLAAYERLTLLMERTKPDVMVLRFDLSNLSVVQVQQLLLTTVREEFEHNMAQQIYVSLELWGMIGTARESIVKLINTTALQCNNGQSGMDYATLLVATFMSVQETPNDVAIDHLKAEVNSLI